MERGIRKSKKSCIVIVSESPKCGAMYYAERVHKEFPDYDVRVSILGHLQRGGRPSPATAFWPAERALVPWRPSCKDNAT